MRIPAAPEFWKDYCFGPADLLEVSQRSDDMRLTLKTADGKRAEAIYRGCVYWQLTPLAAGKRLSLVRRMTAELLLAHHGTPHLAMLRRDTGDAPAALQEWAAAGLHLYLHDTANRGEAYLVAARALEYREN